MTPAPQTTLKPLDQTLTTGSLILSALIALSIATAFEITTAPQNACQRANAATHCAR